MKFLAWYWAPPRAETSPFRHVFSLDRSLWIVHIPGKNMAAASSIY